MTISSALPIQFWAEGTETFNELDVCGINAICFCQPVQCDDTLLFQITDTTGQNIYLGIFDADGVLLATVQFSEISTGLYVVEVIPNDVVDDVLSLPAPICDEVVQFKIFLNPVAVIATSGWTNAGADPFTLGVNTLVEQSDVTFSCRATQPSTGVDINNFEDIPFSVLIFGTWTGTVIIAMVIGDGAGNIRYVEQSFTSNTGGGVTMTLTDTSTADASADYINKLGVTAVKSAGTGSPDIIITVPRGRALVSPEDGDYRSDCIDVREEHECTKLITYSNNSDFAGIDYNASSPSPEFSLRVPAMLFRATRPEEQEVHPLSNDEWLRVWSRMTKKMRLELGYMPDYMHEKLQLILMHDNVEIDGLSWKKRDAYELIEGDKRNPLMKANVLLTDKTFIKRNLI